MKTPILTSLLNIAAGLVGILGTLGAIWLFLNGETGPSLIVAGAVIVQVLLYAGLGQVVLYLARSAHHAERAADVLERQAKPVPADISLPRSVPSSGDPDIDAYLAAKRQRGGV